MAYATCDVHDKLKCSRPPLQGTNPAAEPAMAGDRTGDGHRPPLHREPIPPSSLRWQVTESATVMDRRYREPIPPSSLRWQVTEPATVIDRRYTGNQSRRRACDGR